MNIIGKEKRGEAMDDFPEFMKNKKNKIDSKSQYTEDIEGYVYDGKDGGQVVFWRCGSNRKSTEHTHDFEEYFVIIDGCYTLFMKNKKYVLHPGDEMVIPKGTPHCGECIAGTRTIHAFEKKRADRVT
jgi:mannose-6-phosphate isomerase-like protein (cupin superfamily)